MAPPAFLPTTTPADLLRRVRLVELRARRFVEDLLAGPYRSLFRGRGLEFDEVRAYPPGDDVRSIDWHSTARTGTVQIRQNVEERCLTVLLAVDLSASGDFASGPQSKRERAAELAAVLALSAVRNNDRVGLLLFTDRVERYLPPRAGRRQALAIVAAVLGHAPRGRRTSVRLALQVLGSVLRRRATIFLISDFLDAGFARATTRPRSSTGRTCRCNRCRAGCAGRSGSSWATSISGAANNSRSARRNRRSNSDAAAWTPIRAHWPCSRAIRPRATISCWSGCALPACCTGWGWSRSARPQAGLWTRRSTGCATQPRAWTKP